MVNSVTYWTIETNYWSNLCYLQYFALFQLSQSQKLIFYENVFSGESGDCFSIRNTCERDG